MPQISTLLRFGQPHAQYANVFKDGHQGPRNRRSARRGGWPEVPIVLIFRAIGHVQRRQEYVQVGIRLRRNWTVEVVKEGLFRLSMDGQLYKGLQGSLTVEDADGHWNIIKFVPLNSVTQRRSVRAR